MTFTDEQLESIEKLAGLNYSVGQIAMYLDVDHLKMQKQFSDPDSTFRYHFDRGRLINRADIDQKVLDSAKGGNITAIQQVEKIRISRFFEIMRDELIYGHW